jgi:hypothetical protein
MLQRNFFGFSLLDSKQKVSSSLKQKGYKFTEERSGNLQLIIMGPVTFGGVKWKEVELSFYENKLFSVRFNKPKDDDMQYEINKLSLDLINKYGREMFDISTWWNDPNRVTSLEGKDDYNTRIVLVTSWGLTLKYYDQKVAYLSTHPGANDL